MLENISQLDFAILSFISENFRCGFLDIIMMLFTYAGNWGIVWIAITLVLLFSKRHRGLGITMAIGLIVCLLAGNLLLKPLVARDRPFITDPAIVTIISPPSGYSFPSGHTFSSFCSASVLASHNRKVGIFALISAVLIGFSRLYFCVHFPTDVICGAVLGIASGAAVYRIWGRKLTGKAKKEAPRN